MKKTITAVALVALAVVACVSGYKLVSTLVDYRAASDFYGGVAQSYVVSREPEPSSGEEAAPSETVEFGTGAVIGSKVESDAFVSSAAVGDASPGVASDRAALPPRSTEEQPPLAVDFEGLRAINSDVVGWIYCADTQINYPVLQGRDNQQYLHRMLNGGYSASGSIFLDSLCNPAFRGDNALLYGHHMKNGSMFAGLSLFGKQEYFDAHPCMWLLTPEGNYRIDLFAGFLCKPDDWVYYVTFADTAEKEAYIRRALDLSQVKSAKIPSPLERLITLSTCDYTFKDARFVLLGTLTPTMSPVAADAAAIAARGDELSQRIESIAHWLNRMDRPGRDAE